MGTQKLNQIVIRPKKDISYETVKRKIFRKLNPDTSNLVQVFYPNSTDPKYICEMEHKLNNYFSQVFVSKCVSVLTTNSLGNI